MKIMKKSFLSMKCDVIVFLRKYDVNGVNLTPLTVYFYLPENFYGKKMRNPECRV